jgi:hypothetical protein
MEVMGRVRVFNPLDRLLKNATVFHRHDINMTHLCEIVELISNKVMPDLDRDSYLYGWMSDEVEGWKDHWGKEMWEDYWNGKKWKKLEGKTYSRVMVRRKQKDTNLGSQMLSINI